MLKGPRNYLGKEALFNILPNEKKQRYLALHSECTCSDDPCIETQLMKIFEVNSFMPFYFGTKDEFSGPCVYEIASRFNHDCLPNMARGFSEESYIVFRALRDIKKGEELSNNYIQASGPTEVRRQALLKKYRFVCQCQSCRENRFLSLSDVMESAFLDTGGKTSQVIGKHTNKEAMAAKEVNKWYKELVTRLLQRERDIEEVLRDGALKGQSTKTSRLQTVESLMEDQVKDIILNNKYGLSPEFIESFNERTTRAMIRCTEENFVKTMENGEKNKEMLMNLGESGLKEK